MPADCHDVKVSTPVFAWAQPENRDSNKPWTFVLKKASGEAVITRTNAKPRLYLHDLPLATGAYQWQVTYVDRAGKAQTSAWRRFTIAAEASGVTLPSGASVAARAAAKPSPRLIPTGSSYAAIAKLATAGDYAWPYSEFNAQAAREFKKGAPAITGVPPTPLGVTGLAAVSANKALTDAASSDARAFEILVNSAKFTGNAEYEAAAIDRLMALANLPTRGDTSEANSDQTNRIVYLALAKGLDYLGSKLTASQRTLIATALKDRLSQVMVKMDALDLGPYDSHQLTAVSYVTQALLLAAGRSEFPEAKAWLENSWELWLTTFGTWAGSDGGFGNSVAYGWYNMGFPQFLATAKVIANIDLAKWTPIKQYGQYVMSFTPAYSNLRGAFGDETENTTMYDAYSFDNFRLYAGVVPSSEYEWYWRLKKSNITQQSTISPLHFFLLGTGAVRPSPEPPSQTAQVFRDAGLVAMHSSATDPMRSSVYFRSSPLGSLNHSHADQNSFTFASKGKDLLISGGYYPYFASPHHIAVTRATRFKNALTFDGGIGQSEPATNPSKPGNPVFSADPRGEILSFQNSGNWAMASGDASLAYRGQDPSTKAWAPLLSNAIRTVTYNRAEKVLIIYDWATSADSRSWELNFQTLNPPTVSGKTVKVVNGLASACIDVYGLAGNAPIMSSGFPIAPEKSAADQHRARYAAASPSKELAAITVIREDCRSVPVAVTITGTNAAVAINGGTAASFDKKTVKLPL